MENPIKATWRRGECIVNGWMILPSPELAEIMGQLPFDALCLDLQHGLMDYGAALGMLRAAGSRLPLGCRVPWNEPAMVMKMLDVGCLAIIAPMVNDPTEAKAFVGACRYPPVGYRSWGPTRAQLALGKDYGQWANDQVVTLAMIETQAGLENVEAIAAVEGLDALYIGPADLALSLGHPPLPVPTAPEVLAAIDRILKAARAAGKVAGIHCGSPAMLREMRRRGFQFVTLYSEALFFTQAMAQALAEARGD
ncbi:MAG: HpcH/HpaI aldolase/citrate lyase family protein [Candidatus Competibacterales bacterium]